MKKYKKILFAAFMVVCLSCLFCQPAFAISESEVQAQVDAAGKEAVSGNVLIWFLCAIAFLKVSQKIDSFMASLGVNVGHTGGSMLAEAMIATRGIGGIRNFSRQHFSGGKAGSSASPGGSGGAGFGAGFMAGGLAGVVGRNITNGAVKTATTPPGSKPSGGLGAVIPGAAGGVGGKIYSSSVSRGGNFANNVISSVATGSIAAQGTITGEQYGTKRWGASSFDGNIGLIKNYVRPYLGEKKLRSVKTKTVDDYYHYLETEAEPAMNMGKPMRDHITASTIHDLHKLLRCAFNLAVRWEYINKNLFINATLPEHEEKERVVLSSEQVLRVLKFTCRPEHYDYYTMYCAILIAIGCTTRGGEIGGLQWYRVDYENRQLNIDRAIDRVSKKSIEKLSKLEILFKFPNLFPGTKTVIVLKQPKTKGSVRMVETPKIVLDTLRALKDMQEKLKVELGPEGYMDYDLVICQANGRPIMTEHLNKRFKDILTEMNDPEIISGRSCFP